MSIAKSSILMGLLVLVGCDSTQYYNGHPPRDAQLSVDDFRTDTLNDSIDRRSVRVTFRSKWTIDAGEFTQSAHRLVIQEHPPESSWGMMRMASYSSRWSPLVKSHGLSRAVDSARDTLVCVADTCSWPQMEALLVRDLGYGRWLALDLAHLGIHGEVGP